MTGGGALAAREGTGGTTTACTGAETEAGTGTRASAGAAGGGTSTCIGGLDTTSAAASWRASLSRNFASSERRVRFSSASPLMRSSIPPNLENEMKLQMRTQSMSPTNRRTRKTATISIVIEGSELPRGRGFRGLGEKDMQAMAWQAGKRTKGS